MPDHVSTRLRKALDELGGLYTAFGVFLQWRSDLLDSGHLTALSELEVAARGHTRQDIADLLVSQLGARGQAMATTLPDKPEWITLNRTAWRAKVQDQDVIVQTANLPIADAEIAAFRRGITAMGVTALAGLKNPAVLDQFTEWLRCAETLDTEREYLDAIIRYGGQTSAGYPVPIPDLCTAGLLIWPLVQGVPAAQLIAKGDREICAQIAGAIFEQFCSLGIVEGDLRVDALIVTPDKRLVFRRLARPLPTPPGLAAPALEYVAAAISRDAALSSRTLLRLAISYESPALEKELISKLSAVEPELKVHRWFPPSAETFEANWRAISRLPVERKLYLDCLHRNLVATGYWIGDAVRNGAPAEDVIAEAQWPVLGKILKGQFTSLVNPGTAAHWLASSGLLAMGVMKEASRLAGEIRDNRLSMGFDISSTRGHTESTRPAWLLPLGVFLLSVFLACVRWGNAVPPGFMFPVRALTIAALVGLFWVVLRIR